MPQAIQTTHPTLRGIENASRMSKSSTMCDSTTLVPYSTQVNAFAADNE
jgi:hypothetical protein